MSETYPKKEPLRNAFRRTYSLSVGIDCTGTKKNALLQEKCDFFTLRAMPTLAQPREWTDVPLWLLCGQ